MRSTAMAANRMDQVLVGARKIPSRGGAGALNRPTFLEMALALAAASPSFADRRRDDRVKKFLPDFTGDGRENGTRSHDLLNESREAKGTAMGRRRDWTTTTNACTPRSRTG